MKLHSQRKLKDVQLRVTTNEEVVGLLGQYVTFANTVLGEQYADVRELCTQLLDAFVHDDKRFRDWLRSQGAGNGVGGKEEGKT